MSRFSRFASSLARPARTAPMIAAVFAACLLATSAASAKPRNVTDPDIPRVLPGDSAVSVDWTDPAQFTELRFSGNRWESQRGNWVVQLAEHLRETAEKRLPAGDRLEVNITDIARAGHYEPAGMRMDSIRIMRDIYPPRMELAFRHIDANGRVVSEGQRKLRDSMYLSNSSIIGSNDTLRYEKRLIDDWVRREFTAPATASR